MNWKEIDGVTTTINRDRFGRLVWEVRGNHPAHGPKVIRLVNEQAARRLAGSLPEGRLYRLVPGRMPEEVELRD